MNSALNKTWLWLRSSVWAFPLALLVILLLLTAFRISGSSIGSYYPTLYGRQAKDPDLILNHPRPIRSDEWLIGTQEIVAQSKSGYHKVDPYISNGANIVLQTEIPSKDWSTVFRPQNWSFLLMPIEYAFAFKWWLLMFALMTSCYFFTLRIMPGKKLFAILVSVAAGLSPFALWWYQTSIFAGLAYGFWAIILGMRILNGESVRFIKRRRLSVGLQTALLGFIGGCFGLILYPPFQIPIAIVVLLYLVGYSLNQRAYKKVASGELIKRLGYILLAGLIAALIGVVFILNNRPTIHKLTGTIYPGHRIVRSGDLPVLKVLDGFLMPAEQSDFRGAHFFSNQSEASNFILLMPFLIAPGLLLVFQECRKRRQVDWLFLLLQLCGLMFLARAFLPYGNLPFRILLLDRVPNGRLIIGMGFLGFIQFVFTARKVSLLSKRARDQLLPYSVLYGLLCFILLLWTGFFVREHYPLFVHSWKLLIALAGAFTAIIIALLASRYLLAVCLLLLFTLVSSFRIIPLYRGLGFATHNQIAQAMTRISKPSDTWVTVDNIYFENVGYLAGRRSIGGTQIYPDLKLWEQVGGKKYEDVYNREGHAIFTDNSTLTDPLRLVQSDAFLVQFDCSKFVKKHVNYAISSHPLKHSCTNLVDTIKYPSITFYLYKLGN